ncbi:MAG: relaxase domain-containing protein [Phycisphaerales bacterium]|nr:relaxase domain-containing protein [Phycisphaerales bacterium]
MLRITAKSSAAGAKSYYRDGLARGDYYLADSLAAGIWKGKTAELLGLSGPVSQATFYQLCDNLKPDGTPLTVRTKAGRRVGYDINLDCPKSVSLVHAFGGDDRVAPAFREAVEATMVLIESDARTRVRIAGRSSDRVTGNLIWATFVHDTTRPVAGVPDPHLHSHSFVFNVTHDGVEGRFKAAQLGYIHSNAPFYEAYFHAVLAGKMRALGYGIVRAGRFWELDGVPRDMIERFSYRTTEIREVADRLGITDPKALGQLGARTRGRKSDTKPWDAVRSAWAARLNPDDLAALRDARHLGQREPLGPDARKVLEYARGECMGRSGLVPEKIFLEAALRYGVGYVTLDELRAELPKLGMAEREIRGERHLGDDAKLRDEKQMLTFARETRGTVRSFLDDYVTMPKGATPAEEKALVHLLRSRDQVVIARLRAETGLEVIRQLETRGFEVTRFDAKALNMPHEEAARGPATNPVWWVEHAQHLGTPQMAQLFRLAELGGARVVLAPSPGPVNRHSALPLLGSRAGLRTPAFEAKMNAKAKHREAANAFERGRPASGLKSLDAVEAVKETPLEKLPYAVADAFAGQAKAGGRSRVTVNDEGTAERMTDAIRSALRRLKKLGRSRKLEKLTPAHLNETDRMNPATYKRGQIVVFFRSIKGFRVSQRYKVMGRDPFGNVLVRNLTPRKGLIQSAVPMIEALPLRHPKTFAVFNRSEIELAKGDMIRITMGGRTMNQSFGPEPIMSKRALAKNAEFARMIGLKPPDRRYRVRHGTEHRIKRFTLGGNILLENGWILPKDYGHMDYGYCDVGDTAGATAAFRERDADGSTRTTYYTSDRENLFESARQRQRAAESEYDMNEGMANQQNRKRGRSRGMDYER